MPPKKTWLSTVVRDYCILNFNSCCAPHASVARTVSLIHMPPWHALCHLSTCLRGTHCVTYPHHKLPNFSNAARVYTTHALHYCHTAPVHSCRRHDVARAETVQELTLPYIRTCVVYNFIVDSLYRHIPCTTNRLGPRFLQIHQIACLRAPTHVSSLRLCAPFYFHVFCMVVRSLCLECLRVFMVSSRVHASWFVVVV